MTIALFLDRDGVINRMIKYEYGWDSPQTPQDVKLVKGIIDTIRWVNKRKILAVEISNQPSIAKGKMPPKTSGAIENKVHQLLKRSGVHIDKAYICQHHPQGVVSELTKNCHCRKPKPGLVLRAAKDLKIDLTKSLLLGDKASDVEAGKAAGCKTILFLHQKDVPEKVREAKKIQADFKVISLDKVLPILEDFWQT